MDIKDIRLKMNSNKDCIISRTEDMSQVGELTLCLGDDGDISVTVSNLQYDEMMHAASVEFCNSGTRSPRTHKALQQLALAMLEDEEERPVMLPGSDVVKTTRGEYAERIAEAFAAGESAAKSDPGRARLCLSPVSNLERCECRNWASEQSQWQDKYGADGVEMFAKWWGGADTTIHHPSCRASDDTQPMVDEQFNEEDTGEFNRD